MAPAPRFACTTCCREFIRDFFTKEEDKEKVRTCLFCDLTEKLRVDIRKNSEKLGQLDNRMTLWENDAGLVTAKAIDLEQRETTVSGKIDNLETRIVTIESKVEDSGIFQPARKTCRSVVGVQAREIPTQNRFSLLEDENEDDHSIILIGDSLVRDQSQEFCSKGKKRKSLCFPGARIEDILMKFDDIVSNTPEDTTFVVQIGTNNVCSGRSEEILDKYKTLIGKFRESRRKLIISGLLPRYDASSLTLSRMLGINSRLEALCRQEENVFSIDLWDHFNCDRSLYARDGLHLNGIGKARLGRVLDENVRLFFR